MIGGEKLKVDFLEIRPDSSRLKRRNTSERQVKLVKDQIKDRPSVESQAPGPVHAFYDFHVIVSRNFNLNFA